MVDQAAGSMRLKMSTGSADTYSSAVTMEPSRILRPCGGRGGEMEDVGGGEAVHGVRVERGVGS
jgi:hypothetical protein